MKIFELNSVPYGSTGRIMFQIAEMVEKHGGIAYTAASYTKPRGLELPKKHYQIGSMLGKALHIVLAKLTGRHGCYSHFATYNLIKKIQEVQPDVIHLHNLHGWYINWYMLFNYFKQSNIPIIWTLHDCWAFTGHCPHFMAIGCEKWKTGCFACPLYKEYPGCFIDDSKKQYDLKKQCFTGVPNLTIVTPSRWLAGLVKDSFLKEYKSVVINNGIDLAKFKPTPSNLREKCKLQDKIILLGVAFNWTDKKGLNEFIRLANDLPSDYVIILVGVSREVKTRLPNNILGIECTQSQEELAEIYSAADLFINPTHEEVLGLVNLESLACGTPVITYNSGGSPETIDTSCGVVVPSRDYNELLKTIINFNFHKIKKETCYKRAMFFAKQLKYKEYMELYQKCIKKK